MPERAFLRDWHQALADEAKERFNSFLDLPQELCGQAVRVMRLKDWCKLRAVRSPVACGGEITLEHIAAVVWLLSPYHSVFPEEARIFAFLIYENIAQRRFSDVVREVDTYVERVFLDAPTGGGGGQVHATTEAMIIDRMASEYSGLSFEYILEQPLPRIFDLFRAGDARKHGKSSGSSEKVRAAKSAFMLALNAQPEGDRKVWMDGQREQLAEWRASRS